MGESGSRISGGGNAGLVAERRVGDQTTCGAVAVAGVRFIKFGSIAVVHFALMRVSMVDSLGVGLCKESVFRRTCATRHSQSRSERPGNL